MMGAIVAFSPLVLLPGLHGTGELFGPLLRALPPDLPTHVVPYPGDRFLSYSELVTYLKSRLPKSPFVLLAESFAGPLAMQFTAAHPGRVRGLILVASFARPPLPAVYRFLPLGVLIRYRPPALMRRLLGREPDPELLGQLTRTLAPIPAKLLAARVRAVLSTDATPALRAVTCPILYLRGTHDRLVPAKAVSVIRVHRPDTGVVDIDAPHLVLQTAPNEAANAIQQFLAQPAAFPA
jgi:pimeloyl-ACP methyl ester carboxylesterase